MGGDALFGKLSAILFFLERQCLAFPALLFIFISLSSEAILSFLAALLTKYILF